MPGQSPLTLPACRLAALGPRAVVACPGYRPSRMRADVIRWFRPEPLPIPHPDGMTCAHLGQQLSLRGFRSACGHPGGLPAGAAAVADRLRCAAARSHGIRRRPAPAEGGG
jgi:hypothetical protein